MNKLRVGVIGCGGRAGGHAARLSVLKEVKLTAFCDIIEDKAKVFSEKYGGNVYTDWQRMFDEEKLDIVYVCLPPFAHGDEVMVAAENGIHVFIEKPIALSMDLAGRMTRAVEKYGVKSQVGYQCRFALSIERAKELIRDGDAGEVGLAVGWYLCNFLHLDAWERCAWWRDKEKSGGQIVEQATHLYDILRYLCGDVDRIYGEMNKKFCVDIPSLTVEDVYSATFRFRSGAVGAVVSTLWGVPSHSWFRWLIATENYTLESPKLGILTTYTTKAPVKVTTISEERDLILLQTLNLVKAILEDKETRTPMAEGTKTLEFTLATMRAMETGRVVKLPLR